ncbi:MAG: FeoB-associated Cys-rich membrane protein [Kiritimatiellae bacterium]|nr:FeoB-associated Cys-rich membrane protein [Kiritimatiellia bacterium]
MNVPSLIVVVAVVALAALAARRVFKKGAPCECGGTRGGCCPGCHCRKSAASSGARG